MDHLTHEFAFLAPQPGKYVLEVSSFNYLEFQDIFLGLF